MVWKVADAKNRFSELLDTVDEKGSQEIRRRGKVYVLSSRPEENEGSRNRLVEILTDGPNWDDVVIERIPGSMREIDL